MPEIKWQTQLTYLVEAGETDAETLVALMQAPVTTPANIKPGTQFTVDRELVDRFGPINVIQLLNSDCKSATNRAGLKVELVKVALDAPGKLAPPTVVEQPRPPADLAAMLLLVKQDVAYLKLLATEASRAEIQGQINKLVEVVDAVVDRTF